MACCTSSISMDSGVVKHVCWPVTSQPAEQTWHRQHGRVLPTCSCLRCAKLHLQSTCMCLHTAAIVYVAANPAVKFVEPVLPANPAVVYAGMGMAHRLISSGSSYQFVGVKCNRDEGYNGLSTFGYTTPTWGLQVKPCRRCAGSPILPGPVGGATACSKLQVTPNLCLASVAAS
jgi:hypothetical protein